MFQDPIVILKGDATNAFDARIIRIKVKTSLSLVGATGKFTLLSFSKTFTNAEVLTKTFTISLTSAQTRALPLGSVVGKIVLYDSSNRPMTSSPIPFLVKLAGSAGCGNSRCGSICEYEVVDGYDYDQMFNKPTINNVEVSGDKKGKDYGLNKILQYAASTAYAVGDQVVYQDNWYECTTAIPLGEAWNAAHWRQLVKYGIDANSVHYTADTDKSEAEKTQARQNIGAASAADLSAHTASHNNPHQVTKAQVGLGNVDNTSDANKPVSNAQQAAIDLKVAKASLKAAIADPSSVKLSPASIKAYLQSLYNAIQAL